MPDADRSGVPAADQVALQINFQPTDIRHVRHTLPHQLRQVGRQVHEVVFNLDLHRSRGDFTEGFEREIAPMRELLESTAASLPNARVVEVDYSPEARRAVNDLYFGGAEAPLKNFRGRPFYTSIQPWTTVSADWLLHLDCDMLLGGGSQTWVAEAQAQLREHPDYVVASPLAGPPRPDGQVLRQPDARYVEPAPGFVVPRMSWRVFLINLPKFRQSVGAIPLLPAPLKGRIWTLREDNPPFEKIENIVSRQMQERGLLRIDFLGQDPGMWSLHPPLRSERFFRELPDLVERVERGDVPDEQRGDYDVNDSMIDWSDARRTIRRERMRVMLLGRR
jgi:hypothetical protein